MSESDGIEDAFEGQLRVGLLIAGRVAEELARQREQAARAAEQQSAQAVWDLQERSAAERTTARAVLVPLERAAWWDRATPADIETAWQTARQWADVEPDAARAAETIREQVAARYGIDIDALEAGHRQPGGRGDALARALDDRAAQATAQAAAQVQQHRAEADKETVVATLLAGEAADERAAVDVAPTTGDAVRAGVEEGAHRDAAERAENGAAAAATGVDVAGATALAARATEAGSSGAASAAAASEPGYDSSQRRAATARDLHAGVGAEYAEAIEARMSADVANARPVTAVAPAAGRADARTGRRRPLR